MKTTTKKTVTVEINGNGMDGARAEIVAGESIRICGRYTNHVNGPQAFDRTFKLGDTCERDSYNLAYTGKITAIGLKMVTIKDDCLAKTSRLSLADFAWRNWNYDAEKIAARNSSWMD